MGCGFGWFLAGMGVGVFCTVLYAIALANITAGKK